MIQLKKGYGTSDIAGLYCTCPIVDIYSKHEATGHDNCVCTLLDVDDKEIGTLNIMDATITEGD